MVNIKWKYVLSVACGAVVVFCLSAVGMDDAALLYGPAPCVSARIDNVPHVQQKKDFCGEACAAMYLRYLGEQADQDYVFDQGDVDPALGRGLVTAELNLALKQIGFDTGFDANDVWTQIDNEHQVGVLFREMVIDLKNEVPSIVCINAGPRLKTSEHFVLVLGYDHLRDTVLYHDPAMVGGAYLVMDRVDFLERWPLKWGHGNRTVVRMPLKVDALEYTSRANTPTGADYAQRVMKIKKIMPPNFTLVISPPFVVVGDGAPERVRQQANTTVQWTVQYLKQDFFAADPKEVLAIWLFESEASYKWGVTHLFSHEIDTPYGYYAPDDNALIMNIGLGGGTLVHEIVHPYMAVNFPQCPTWLNEGLGSLFEWPTELNGHLAGVVNWRLEGLQARIRAGTLGTFEGLMRTSASQFYGVDAGAHYAQSRFLCQYLQFRGLLAQFYHAAKKNYQMDPYGVAALKRVLGVDSLADFQRDWEAWVMTLHQGDIPMQ